MPRSTYSYGSGAELRSFAISEPDDQWGSSPRSERTASSDDQEFAIQAKEPDRQTSNRRGRTSSRSRATVAETEEETRPRRRAVPQRAAAPARGAQARRSTARPTVARRTATTEPKTTGRTKKSRRGFAAMSPEQQREIARKGGLTVSRNRRHMADIGRVGGEHSHGGRRGRR